ncbi:hypothetical protein C8Q80DRAFT_1129880 [Daedaleopsis nitida]|nr:hypothetical protein C8Q80DRAFT_1129880 [Daedaleopsis nitida]
MPWRVGRDLRHLSQAVHTVLERLRTPLRPPWLNAKPLHSTRGALWPPAVALKLSHSHASIENPSSLQSQQEQLCTDEALDGLALRQDTSKQGMSGNLTAPLSPSPEVLAALDRLFARYPSHRFRIDLLGTGANDLIHYLRNPRYAPGLVLYLMDSRGPDFAIRTVEFANESGYHFSVKFYCHLADELAKGKRWRDIIRLTSLARRYLGRTTTDLLNRRLHALGEVQHVVPVADALSLFEKEHVIPSRHTYHLLIAMHLRNRDLTSVLTAVEVMQTSGFPVTDVTFSIIVHNYRSLGLSPSLKAEALAALASATNDRVAGAILNGLIQLMLDADDMPGVTELLFAASRECEDQDSPLGADTIQDGDATSSACESGSAVFPPTPSPLPSHIRSLIDVTTYSKLLNHFARQGDVPGAIHVIQEMRAAGTAPDSRTSAALVRLYFAAGYPNDALHVVARVLERSPEAAGILPSLGFEDAIAPQHPIPPPTLPSTQLFNALLEGVFKVYRYRGFHAVLTMMRMTRVDADAMTLSILLTNKLRLEGRASREVIRIVRILMSVGVTPTLQHLNILLHSLSRKFVMPRGWHVTGPRISSEASISTATANPPAHDAELFLPNAGMTFPHYPRLHRHVRPVVQSLADRGVQSDRATLAMRIKQDALVTKDMDAAKRTFRHMLAAGLQPTLHHYGPLMEGYAAVGDMDAAADVMRSATGAGVKADVKTHTILVAGWARLARPTFAVKAFRNMVAEGVRPDVPAIDALVSAFFRAKAYGVARRVLLQLWPQVALIPRELSGASLRELAVAFRLLHWTNKAVRERLTYMEQQALRNTIRAISRTWRDMRTKGSRLKRERHARDVTTRNSKYNRLGG